MNEPSYHSLIRNQFGERAKFNEPLAPYLAYRVGGPAEVLLFPKTESELDWISAFSKSWKLPITVIGTGTNLLVRDEGIRGLVLSLRDSFDQIEKRTSGDSTLVRCGGGVGKPQFLEWAIQQSLTGLEFSAGVPGTIGGGIFMNAGTKYGSYGDILRELRLYDFKTGARQFKTTTAQFGYREQQVVKDTLVLWAEFELKPGDKGAVRREVERIIEERAAKQPLDFPSCGSTFKNPEGYSAGRLIEKAGLKGRTVGGAEISLKHANFILNKGNARASDILSLISLIKSEVFAQFGVQLECEVIILGEGSGAEGKIPH